jgi:hypothetical protein
MIAKMKTFTLLLIITMACPALAQTVQVAGNGIFELSGEFKQQTIAIPLIYNGNKSFADIVEARITHVKLKDRHDLEYQDAIILKEDTVKKQLLLVADLARLKSHGSYEISMQLTVDKLLTNIALVLNKPAAILDTVRGVQVSIIGYDVSKNTLAIREEGYKGGVQDLQLPQPLFAALSFDTPLLAFTKKPVSVPAGGVFSTEFSFNEKYIDDFPLGKTKGFIELAGPELSTPLTIPVTITHKRRTSWIPILVVGGLLLGFVMRIIVPTGRGFEEKKTQAYELIETIRNELSQISDVEFKTSILKEISPLIQKLSSSSLMKFNSAGLTELQTSIDNLKTSWNARIQSLESDIKIIQGELSKFANAMTLPTVEPVLQSYFARARAEYESAVADLAAKNRSGSRLHKSAMQIEAQQALAGYLGTISKHLADLNSGEIYPVFPGGNKTILERCAQISSTIPAAKKLESDWSDLPALSALNIIQQNFATLITSIADEAHSLFNKSYDPKAGTVEMQNFKRAFDQWEASFVLIAGNPAAPNEILRHRKELVGAWENLGDGAVLGNKGGAEKFSMAEWNKADLEPGTVAGLDLPELPRLDFAKSDASKNWLIYSLARAAILCLLILVVMYKIYAPSFIGTFAERLTIFLFAFGLDVTLDNIGILASKKN